MNENKMSVTVEEFEKNDGERMIIDVRSEHEFSKDSMEGAICIPRNRFFITTIAKEEKTDFNIKEKEFVIPEEFLRLWQSKLPVYVLSYSGEKSEDIVEELNKRGYASYNVEGGYKEYLRIKLKQYMEQEDFNIVKNRHKDIERSLVKRFRKEIWRKFVSAIQEYDMIQDGDKIAVCISGGKDSMLMAKLFQELYRHGKQNFELAFLVMNPGYNEENYQRIVDNAKILGIPIQVFDSDIFEVVSDVVDSPCYLCARMRRGNLYSKAKEFGCNKIALGHHFDDVIETILMGMLYGGQVQTMMPKLHSTNFEGMELIRPLYLVREDDIILWAKYNDLHFIQCACRFTENCASCDDMEKDSKRAEIKALIKELAGKSPVIEKNIFRSVENVNLNTVIAYKKDGEKHHFLDTYNKVKTTSDEGKIEQALENSEESS